MIMDLLVALVFFAPALALLILLSFTKRHIHKWRAWSKPYQVKYLLVPDIDPSSGAVTDRGERIVTVQERSCSKCNMWEQKEV